MNLNLFIVISIIVVLTKSQNDEAPRPGLVNPVFGLPPCNRSKVFATFTIGLPPEEENQYDLSINYSILRHTVIVLKFDSDASLTLKTKGVARMSTFSNSFTIEFYNDSPNLGLKVKGLKRGIIPYITSLKINNVEFCENAKTGYFDDDILGEELTASVSLNTPDTSCGRRRIDHTELIVNGDQTKPGDWPWHTALYRLNGVNLKYICGGTLISKTLVLTAAHCVTIRGEPLLTETLNVVFGKYNLIGGDISSQEREVHEIIVHENFDYRLLNNDAAILKLKTEVVFNDYIQPACLWQANALPEGSILGTVVGWGFDSSDSLTTQLRQAVIPKVSEPTCLRSNPVFFSKMLTPQKFCAGFGNGTAPCNGDSGGGFHIFVPDTTEYKSPKASGSYYVTGIVSTSLARRDIAICDPESYVLFTDVSKIIGWISKYYK